MQQNWMSRFSDNIRDYDGYAIGKLFKLLGDPEMISLAGGLPSPDTFLKDDLQRVSQKRLQEYFPEDMGVSWTKPKGGLFLWATVPQKIDTLELFYEAIKFKVAFVPGEVFYGEKPAKNHMRINFSYPSKNQLAEAVKRLSDCIKNQL